MKHVGKVAICLASGLALQTGLPAVTADNSGNPYAGIVDRNVFALKPAPPAPPPPLSPDQLPQKIIPTAIVMAFGKKQAFFKTPPSGKPGEAAKEASYMLSEGERAGDIEVLEINVDEHTFRVRNHGAEQQLDLLKDGMKPQGSGAAAVPGGMPLAAGTLPAVPNMNFQGGGVPAPSLTPVPTLGGSGAASVQRPLRVIPQQGAAPPQVRPQTMSPEEQIVHMGVHNVINADAISKGEMPPLPPIPELEGQ